LQEVHIVVSLHLALQSFRRLLAAQHGGVALFYGGFQLRFHIGKFELRRSQCGLALADTLSRVAPNREREPNAHAAVVLPCDVFPCEAHGEFRQGFHTGQFGFVLLAVDLGGGNQCGRLRRRGAFQQGRESRHGRRVVERVGVGNGMSAVEPS